MKAGRLIEPGEEKIHGAQQHRGLPQNAEEDRTPELAFGGFNTHVEAANVFLGGENVALGDQLDLDGLGNGACLRGGNVGFFQNLQGSSLYRPVGGNDTPPRQGGHRRSGWGCS